MVFITFLCRSLFIFKSPGESRQGAGNCLGEVVVETGVGDGMCRRRRWINAGENGKEKGKERVSRENGSVFCRDYSALRHR